MGDSALTQSVENSGAGDSEVLSEPDDWATGTNSRAPKLRARTVGNFADPDALWHAMYQLELSARARRSKPIDDNEFEA